jgi:dipicolinate synthase subunit A
VHVSALDGVLPGFPLVFNTVPAPVLGGDRLARLPDHAVVIELASAPGGDDSGDNPHRGGMRN